VDEDDLKSRFEKKAFILQAILQNARTMFDATSGVKLFDVFTYKTHCNNGAESRTKASRTLEADQNIKGNKQPKAPGTKLETPEQEDPDEPIELKKSHRSQVAGWRGQLKRLEREIVSRITFAKDEQVKDLMPADLCQKLILQKEACAVFVAQLQLWLHRNTMIGKFTACLAPYKELKRNSLHVLADSSRWMTSALVGAKCVKRKLDMSDQIKIRRMRKSFGKGIASQCGEGIASQWP
jgi:hypothetical protein